MKSVSPVIETAQQSVHPALLNRLRRHLEIPWRQPLHVPTWEQFDRLRPLLDGRGGEIILDSGCGTGESTLKLAEQFPNHLVIGIDQSAVRLQRLAPEGLASRGNAILVRAELSSFWRLFNSEGLRAEWHYLLYPNPWPKAAHLGRRWHGHPVFADLMRSARHFELRSNWRVYVDEFATALQLVGFPRGVIEVFSPVDSLTPFEQKYFDSGHQLYRYRSGMSDLGQAPQVSVRE